MKSMRNIWSALAAVALLGACAPAMEQARPETQVNSRTQLVVNNQNWLDMNVYLVRNGFGQRLGTVESMRTATFRIPDAYVLGVSDIQVAARPIGSNEQYVSTSIQVFPGSEINLELQNQLQLSYYSVRAAGLR